METPKPPKPKIVIGIPSLSQFESDDEDDVQKVVPKKTVVSCIYVNFTQIIFDFLIAL